MAGKVVADDLNDLIERANENEQKALAGLLLILKAELCLKEGNEFYSILKELEPWCLTRSAQLKSAMVG